MTVTVTMIFPLVVGAFELIAGIVYFVKGQYGLGVAWVSYAVACVGLAFAGK